MNHCILVGSSGEPLLIKHRFWQSVKNAERESHAAKGKNSSKLRINDTSGARGNHVSTPGNGDKPKPMIVRVQITNKNVRHEIS